MKIRRLARSAISGRFVSREKAENDPEATVVETVKSQASSVYVVKTANDVLHAFASDVAARGFVADLETEESVEIVVVPFSQ